MYFITCFDRRWLENAELMCAENPPRDSDGKLPYHANTATRCFGYFSDLARAKAAVERNEMDLHECLYIYCVIEHLPEGIHPLDLDTPPLWYGWRENAWTPIEAPEATRQMIGFALG